MASFPTFQFTKDNVKVRFLEPTVSKSTNQRFLGLPRGVYVGFRPTVTSGSPILTLARDPRLGFSTLKVGASSVVVQVDVFTAQDVQINFTGHTQFPVFVIGRADYTTETPTQGRILTRATGPSGPQEVGICVVSKPGTDLVVSQTVPGQRQPPLAFTGQATGFMYPGATDDIVFAQSATAEVVYARQSLKVPGAPPPLRRLADRLTLDLGAPYLGDLTGLRTITVQGNAQIVPAATGSVNVSSSFGEITRQDLPALTIEAGGSEVAEGAITAPIDPNDRNVCFVVNATTGQRTITAGESPIYGRLSYLTGAVTPGTLAFTNAGTTVVGTFTGFPGVLQVGDLILGADSKFYAVTSFTDATHLVIAPAYQGTSASGVSSTFRRFTLNLFTRETGAELAATLPSATNLRFFFPAWFRTDRPVFDATALMKKIGERAVEDIATDTVKGRALVAVGGGKVGSVYQVKSNAIPLGATNFHTLNFTAPGASITTSGGQANIAVTGPPGPPGAGAVIGPTGTIPGPPAAGFNNFNPGGTAVSGQISGALNAPSGSTFTVDFALLSPVLGPVVHASAGLAGFESTGWTGALFRIASVGVVGTMVTVGYQTDVNAKVRLFVGACY